MRRSSKGMRWLAVLLGVSLVLGMVPTAALAEAAASDGGDEAIVEQSGGEQGGGEQGGVEADGSVKQPEDGQDGEDTGEKDEAIVAASRRSAPAKAPAASSLQDVYVSETEGDNENAGTDVAPLETIQAAVKAVQDGGTIHLESDITLTNYVYIGSKTVTIDGGGNTVTRAEGFAGAVDPGRGGYNPAMIEVQEEATLTLSHITLDDANLQPNNNLKPDEPILYQEQSTKNKENRDKVQAAIIEASGDGEGTIILDSGAVLKNFGGMSAVRIGGQVDGKKSSLIMKAGSEICDDSGTTHGDETASNDDRGANKDGVGPVGAIWNQGGTFTMEAGASIHDLSGRAIFDEDGGTTYVDGSISNITSSETERNYSWSGSGSPTTGGFGGIVYFGTPSTAGFTLGPHGSISNITSHDGRGVDVMFMLVDASMTTEEGSEISDSTVSLADSNGGRIYINGAVENISSDNVIVRGRGTANTFKVGETGQITNCSTTDVSLYYHNGGKPTIEIAGSISDITAGDVLWVSDHGLRSDGTVDITGTIKDCSGTAVLAGDPSVVNVSGTISGCGGYAVLYGAKLLGTSESLVNIADGAVISGNHEGGAQIQVTRNSDDLVADDAGQHVTIVPGTLQGSTTIDLAPFTMTLDSDYASIKLGNASTSAADAIEGALVNEHPSWTVVNKDAGPIWFQPSTNSLHFVASRPSDTKKTGLYAAYVPLNEDGTPDSGAEVKFVEAKNSDSIDVTLDGLTPGQSYALVFVNSDEYTIAPDDVTIYTGGGQGDESYDDGGWPAVTLTNSLDEITEMTYDGQNVMADGTDPLEYLMNNLVVSYTTVDGTPVTDDSDAGEYLIHLGWKDGFDPTKLRINKNVVNSELGTGIIIVRYVEDVDEAISGESTYVVRTSEPSKMEPHAVAVVDENASFTLNGDPNRPVDDKTGVSVLDDSLLTNTGDNRQELLEQRAADSGLLPDLGAGEAYRFAFRYLDLVDAKNGNAWVANNGDTTIYLPYPDGMTYEDAQDIDFTLVHFKDLHREYGIEGQAAVEDAIANSELETIDTESTELGLKFTVSSSGFSPFAVVWKTNAHTIAASAGEGGTISPSGSVVVGEGADKSFVMTPNEGYVIDQVLVDGQSVDLADVVAEDGTGVYTFSSIDADHTIDVTFRSAQHTIATSAGEGGVITPSGAVVVDDGASQEFKITPDAGYQIADVKVDGVSVGRVDSYTFGDVTADHTIEATFEAESVTPPAHEHAWSDWQHDETSHWKVCQECGAVTDRAEHVFGEWELVSDGQWERTCTICGYVQKGTTPATEQTDGSGQSGDTSSSQAAGGEAVPQTGDATNTVLPTLLVAGGAALIAGAVAFRSRRRKN